MSWRTLNQILGLATIDPRFCQQLQENPSAALVEQGFEVTADELAVFMLFRSLPFSQFCQLLQEKVPPDV